MHAAAAARLPRHHLPSAAAAAPRCPACRWRPPWRSRAAAASAAAAVLPPPPLPQLRQAAAAAGGGSGGAAGPAEQHQQQQKQQQQQQQLAAELQREVERMLREAANGDPGPAGAAADDAAVVAQETALAHALLSQCGALPDELSRPAALAAHALQLTRLTGTGSAFRMLGVIKRHPALLRVPPAEVASRVLALKLLMPRANVPELLYQKPSLLLYRDPAAALTPALNKLHALMPGIPVESKLHEGGTVFWSFASLLDGAGTAQGGGAGGAGGAP